MTDEGTVRRPRGYRGIDHETIGSDVLAVQHALKWLSGSAANVVRILGPEATKRLSEIDPEGWYPIEWLLEMMESIDRSIGQFGLIKLGRVLFEHSHKERATKLLHCGRDVIHGIDGMYRHANRGTDIGGWAVRVFDGRHAELEKTTPHHCKMEEGLLNEALKAVGSPAFIRQTQCFREGAPSCIFHIEPNLVSGAWTEPTSGR